MPLLAAVTVSCDSTGNGSDQTPQPQITGYTTDYDGKVVSGDPVVINGLNFSLVPSENKVVYGEGIETTSLRVSDSGEDYIVFTAPQTTDERLEIRVVTNGKTSNTIVLEFDNALADKEAVAVSTILKNGTTVTIREGIEWISYHGVWEGQVRLINIVKTQLNEHNKLGLYFDFYSEDNDRQLDTKCEYLDAIVGTNGPMGCCHFVRVDGEVKKGPVEQGETFNCALTIDGDDVDIVKVKDNYAAAALPNRTVGFAGPLLVYDSQVQRYKQDNTDSFLYTTHPRTAIGISKDKKTVYQVTVDGRWTSSNAAKRAIGMETWVLGKLMKGLGSDRAMNFDGGGGTAMWIYEQGRGGIVNRPSDSGSWDDLFLRPTGCAVYIKSDLKRQ